MCADNVEGRGLRESRVPRNDDAEGSVAKDVTFWQNCHVRRRSETDYWFFVRFFC